jgi:hypothetical protein
MKKRDLKIYLFLVVFGILVIGGLGAAAYYGEELGVFLKGGWNRPAIASLAKDFITRVQQKDYEGAITLADTNRLKPVREGNQIVGLEKVDPSGMSPGNYTFEGMFPPEEPKVTAVEWSNADGGAFLVSLIFPGGQETRFLVQRVDGAFKIVSYLG